MLISSIAIAPLGCGSSNGGGSGFASMATAPVTSSASPTPTSTATAPSTSSSTTTPATASAPKNPIEHVFIIVKENHTYDNFFGTFKGGDGATHAIDRKGKIHELKPAVTDLDLPGNNSRDAAVKDWDQGKMDAFHDGEQSGVLFTAVGLIFKGPWVTYSPKNGVASGPAKYYWEIAEQGVLCDRYFTSVMGPSSPNHLFTVAADCGGLISNENLLTHKVKVLDSAGKVHDHPNHFSASEIKTTLPNELEKKGLPWVYYQESPGSGPIPKIISTLEDNDASIAMLDVVKALPSFKTSFDEKTEKLDHNLAGLLAQGKVGAVTWIKPGPFNSEHPMLGHVTKGADWTRQIVNAIGQSQYWGKCAILITWDDYGGFYDHVPPPQVDHLGMGFRVPCVVVSPFAKKGVIDHTVFEHSSLVKFAETCFGIAPMNARDAAAGDMLDAFDFTQAPRDFSEFKR